MTREIWRHDFAVLSVASGVGEAFTLVVIVVGSLGIILTTSICEDVVRSTTFPSIATFGSRELGQVISWMEW